MIEQKKFRLYLISLAFVLFSVTLIGLFWLSTTSSQTVGLTLSFAAGLSMIFLPCTLPLAFVIVPLSMGKDPKKGFLMALFFGLGLAITLSIYGVILAITGKFLGIGRATKLMWLVAGLAAFIFGLGELKLLPFRAPTFKSKVPNFIQRRADYLKVFFLGLFLGNAGVGCPNPAFYVLLAYIITTANLGYGWLLGFIHGVGRAIPLIFLSVLGILGINALGGVVKRKVTVEKFMGWALVSLGAFILTMGLFGNRWWAQSLFHWRWAEFVYKISPRLSESAFGHVGALEIFPWIVFLGLIIVPILYYLAKRKWGAAGQKIALIMTLILLIVGAFVYGQRMIKSPLTTGEVKEIEVVSYSWDWNPKLIEVNQGDLVRLKITVPENDVPHGFGLTEYGLNIYLPVGKTIIVEFLADKAGEFTFYCSIPCGPGHGVMVGQLIVVETHEDEPGTLPGHEH